MALVAYASYTGDKIILLGKQCYTISIKGIGTYTRIYLYPLVNITGIVGTWTPVIIGMYRYIVFTHSPLQAARLCSVSRTRKQMLSIVVIAVIYALPRFFEMDIRKKRDGSVYLVDVLWGNIWYYYVYFCGIHFIFVFWIPFTMLLFFCMRLKFALRKATRQQVTNNRGSHLDTRITSMLLVLIAVFLFVMVTFGFITLFSQFGPQKQTSSLLSHCFWVFSYIS